jgi:dTDP-4-dehydrorhamnose 3,5-epimerase
MGLLITGANGQLGKELAKKYPDAQTVDVKELDIANLEQVANYDWKDIDTIINAAAYTKVDEAETPEGFISSWSANSVGVANLATISKQNEISLVHISTDYVFDGKKNTPYEESDNINPLSVYGKSKASGEFAASYAYKPYIIRTSWLIGAGGNFVKTMLSLGERGINPSVVSDQIGRPTFTVDLVRAIDHLMSKAEPGTYHVSNEGDSVSWADFALEIFKFAGYPNKVNPVSTQEYYSDKSASAIRPKNSIFNLTKLEQTGFINRDWREALQEYVKQEVL